jgi:phenylalanyl-tRNA synthetase alpha chain
MHCLLLKIILQERCKTHSIFQLRGNQYQQADTKFQKFPDFISKDGIVLAKVRSDVGRFFSVGRVFRNEKLSYKHLVEFHQVEGVATAQDASLRDLIGLQQEFYSKMGIKRIKFWPTFFPYTEPSLQSMVYNEKLEKWVELFGMGIFRPEVTEPLGIKNRVLAWGGGLERIAMLRFGLNDVRELYGNRLAWLRSVPRCQL